jgi:hypothetical protein
MGKKKFDIRSLSTQQSPQADQCQEADHDPGYHTRGTEPAHFHRRRKPGGFFYHLRFRRRRLIAAAGLVTQPSQHAGYVTWRDRAAARAVILKLAVEAGSRSEAPVRKPAEATIPPAKFMALLAAAVLFREREALVLYRTELVTPLNDDAATLAWIRKYPFPAHLPLAFDDFSLLWHVGKSSFFCGSMSLYS